MRTGEDPHHHLRFNWWWAVWGLVGLVLWTLLVWSIKSIVSLI